MANGRVAQFQRDITKAMSAGGWEYVSWLELPHYRLIKLEEERLFLAVAGEDYGLTSVNDARSGKPHDPERQRLAEIINRLNDLYGPEVSDDDKLHFANGIADCIECDEALMAQVYTPSQDQMRHGLFLNKVTDAVFDALSDHEVLSMPLLEDEKTGRQFALLSLRLLAGGTSCALVLNSNLGRGGITTDNDLERNLFRSVAWLPSSIHLESDKNWGGKLNTE